MNNFRTIIIVAICARFSASVWCWKNRKLRLSVFFIAELFLLLEKGTLSILDEPELVLQAQRLERIYNVSVSIEKTASDFLNVVPIKPL